MKGIVKKIVFPFYRDTRHKFLTGNWLFRAVVVVYVVAFVVAPFVLITYFQNSQGDPCYGTLHLYYDMPDQFDKELAFCGELLRDALPKSIGGGILVWLLSHYLIQLVFYKVVVDYIILGGRKANRKMAS